jgi:hypothetical protein
MLRISMLSADLQTAIIKVMHIYVDKLTPILRARLTGALLFCGWV